MARITLVLSAGPSQPEGSAEERLEMHVVLTPHGRLDELAWQGDGGGWQVRHLRGDAPAAEGELVRLDGSWALREAPGEDAPLQNFNARMIRPGEYATLRGTDGAQRSFRIVAVEPD